MKQYLLTLILLTFIVSCKKNSENTVGKTTYLKEGFIEVLDKEMSLIIDPEAQLEVLSENHDWTEGPLWLEESETILFSDIPRNTIYSWNEIMGVKEYLKPSGFTGTNFKGSEPGSNGLLLDPEGNLLLCQHGNRQVAKMNASLENPIADYTAVADNYEGKKLNSPNDAVYDTKGNLFFTDPPYGLPKKMEDPDKELAFQGVFKKGVDGELVLLDDQLSRPNGIGFSPDEKTLYVANSDPENAIWMSYELDSLGTIISKRILFDATNFVAKEKGLPDGLKVNKQGYLFATGPGGVWIFNPSGKHIGNIKTGRATANVALDHSEKVLFITADSYLLRLKLN